MGLCRFVQVCGRQLVFLVFCRRCDFCHEGTDALAEVNNLDVEIPQECAACLSPHDCDCFLVNFGQIEFYGKP